MISNIFFACARLISCCGKKNCAMPYSLSSPISNPSFLQAFLKNLWEIWRRIPTPSPVLPSASLPARCSRCSTIFNAFATVSWVFLPLILTTAPVVMLKFRPVQTLLLLLLFSHFFHNLLILSISAAVLRLFSYRRPPE